MLDVPPSLKDGGKEQSTDALSKASLASTVREVFHRFDKSGDGALDLAELRRSLKALDPQSTHEQCKNIAKEVDKSGDGSVSYKEFMEWINAGGEKADKIKRAMLRETGDARKNKIRQSFLRYDSSGDGNLDIPELQRVLKTMGSFTNAEIGRICTDLDSSGDGQVSFEEFESWVRNGACDKEIYKAKAILAPADGDGVEGVFYNFCGAGRCDMDGKSFLKMCRDCKLLDKKLTETDIDLIFTNKKVKQQGQRCIDFDQWEVAMEFLAQKKGVPFETVTQAVLEATRPILQGTQATNAPQFVQAGVKVAINRSTEKTRRKRIRQLMRSVPEADLSAKFDNSDLWKTFGGGTNAGRTLKRLYRTELSPDRSGNGAERSEMQSKMSTHLPSVNIPHRQSHNSSSGRLPNGKGMTSSVSLPSLPSAQSPFDFSSPLQTSGLKRQQQATFGLH